MTGTARVGSAVLVGRDDELAVLRTAAQRADAGEPGVVLVLGEAGIGKSRLVAELVDGLAADGAVVAVSHGVELAGGELPYGGAAELVRSLARDPGVADVRRAAPSDVAALAALHRPLAEDTQPVATPDRAAVTGALLSVLEGLATDRLVVWVLDDLPWLDLPTRDLVTYLARVARGRLLFVGTVRTEPSAPDELPDEVEELGRLAGSTVLTLAPLDEAAVAAQVAAIAGPDLAADTVARICRVSDGLPFFVEQLVSAGGPLPGSLRKLVQAGVRGLSDDARVLLRAASLAEALLVPELLAAACGLDGEAFTDALDEVRRRGVLRVDRSGEVLRFRHALLREAIESELLAAERRALHRRWAEVLVAADEEAYPPGAVVIERARHWYESGDRDAAFPAVLRAARAVEDVPDFALHARWWGRALECWGSDAAYDGVDRDWALGCCILGLTTNYEFARARSLVEDELARSAPDDWLRRTWLRALRRQLALLADEPVQPSAPVAEADEWFERLTAQPPDFRVDDLLHLLAHEWEAGRPDLLVPICEAILERATARGHQILAQVALRHLGWWAVEQGRPELQLEYCLRQLDVTEPTGPFRSEADGDVAWAYLEAGRTAEAIAHGISALDRIPDPRVIQGSWARLVTAVVDALTRAGRWDEALRLAEGADEHAPSRLSQLVLGENRAKILARRGRLDVAEAAATALPVLDRPDDMPGVRADFLLTRRIALAELDLARGKGPDEAGLEDMASLERPGAAPVTAWGLVVALARALGAGGAGEADAGLAARITAEAGRLSSGGPIGGASSAELAAHVARVAGEDRAEDWAAVAQRWADLDYAYDAAWCRLLEGEARVREGDRDAAREVLGAALATADRLGAQPLRERVVAAARRGRVDLEAAARRTPLDGLTARETEVLVLLAGGRTNGQIATELFMSPKTVSVHVSRIIAKLGVANRTEAAARAHRAGLV